MGNESQMGVTSRNSTARLVCLAIPLLLFISACKPLSDPTTAFTTVEAAYAGAISGELLWLESGTRAASTVRQVEGLRLAAHSALAPVEAQLASGTVPGSDTILAAQVAVAAFSSWIEGNTK